MIRHVLLVAWLGLAFGAACACGNHARTVTEEPVAHTELKHAALLDAIRKKGDASLTAFFASEADYFAEPVPFAALSQTRMFRVVPTDTSEPVDFLFGVDGRTGDAILTSMNAPGVAQVVFAETDVFEKQGLAQLAFELIRPRAVALTFVASATDLPEAARASFVAPSQSRQGGGLRLDFQVVDEDQVVAWHLELSLTTGRLTTRPVASGAL